MAEDVKGIQRTVLYARIPADLHQEVKVAAAAARVSVQSLVELALRLELLRREFADED